MLLAEEFIDSVMALFLGGTAFLASTSTSTTMHFFMGWHVYGLVTLFVTVCFVHYFYHVNSPFLVGRLAAPMGGAKTPALPSPTLRYFLGISTDTEQGMRYRCACPKQFVNVKVW